jgi:putative ABC transport system permease protein
MFNNYLRTAWAVFMRRKLFTAINLLCIVLTLVVLMVITALLEFAFYPSGVEGKSDRFLQVAMIELQGPGGPRGMSYSNSPVGYKLIEKYLKPLKSVELVSAVTLPATVSVYQQDRVSELLMRRADAAYWKILDFTVLAGRVPNEDDVAQGRFVAVVNASTAKKLFPAGAALAQKISVSGQSFEIIGVVEDAIHFNALADIWVPLTTFPSQNYREQLTGNFTALLLAKSAADLPQLQREVRMVSKTIEFDDPKKWNKALFFADSKLDLFARQVLPHGRQVEASGAGTLLAIIGSAMLLFMLLPALNLINLNIGRILERSAEIGVRKAFGATSVQLVGQLVMENVLLCLAGGLLGLLCAQGVLWWLAGSGLVPYLDIHINLAVFGYGLVISTLFGVLSGVIPAWKMSRLDPVFALKGAA